MFQYIMLFIFHITDAIMAWTNALASSRNQALQLFPVCVGYVWESHHNTHRG